METSNDAIGFGKSQFKGKSGLSFEMYRWCIQFSALILKNFAVMLRRPLQLIVFLMLPSVVFLAFLIQDHERSDNNGNGEVLYPTIPIEGLGGCDVYYDSKCLRVAYGPKTAKTDVIMDNFCSLNGLNCNSDVMGFETIHETQDYVASHIGHVQFTIMFRNASLWETYYYSPDNVPIAKNMSYVIFHNNSRDNDQRSKEYGVNFPLLVVQKSLEEAYLRTTSRWSAVNSSYQVEYGELWRLSYQSSSDDDLMENSTSTNSTGGCCDCDKRTRAEELGIAMPWVLVFVFLFVSNISFQVVADEKRKKLFMSLRRLGLLDSAYWMSWFVTFQVLLVVGCGLSLIAAVGVRTVSPSLRAINLSVMFLLLYLSGSASIASSFFLASFCNSSSAATSLAFTQFLVALLTIAPAIKPLNSYEYVKESCRYVSSSYNIVYSPQLLGYTFVQFLVFFIPFFHSAQGITDIISIVQYKSETVHFNNLGSPVSLVYSSEDKNTFDSMWIGWSFRMLAVDCVMYLLLAWLAGQLVSSDASEGRSLFSVLVPGPLKRLLLGSGDVVQEGDIRGEERMKSREDGNVRAYKVSKTYGGVQALREVSFSMKRGEVFVMLGHNGAGKSTLINIITGVIAPTHGKVYIKGLDVENDVSEIQQTIGVCSQDDLLWDELTAKEHMLLTAAFKGLQWGPQLFAAVDNVLNTMQLLDRANNFCSQYSGGMKRRLSVAMSTVGDVEILFLDEPSTGLDPVNRRKVWEAINIMKKDRVVVLTTHNMEECDFLADTIMIMHDGHVRAFGDPLFLKQTYGRGYQVNLFVDPDCLEETTSLVEQVLPDATCTVDESASGIFVTVPKANVMGLPRLFSWLEQSPRAAAVVREWGVSNTTLEQVFLMLSALNTDTNTSAIAGDEQIVAKQNLCPMCRSNKKCSVFMRTLSSEAMLIPDSLCWSCASLNPDFAVTEEEVTRILEVESPDRDVEMGGMLKRAQHNAELSATEHILALEEKAFEAEDRFDTSEWESTEDSSLLKGIGSERAVTETDGTSVGAPLSSSQKTKSLSAGSNGTVVAQVHAVMLKNLVLQSRQRCSNVCSALFVATMFFMLYFMNLLFTPLNDIQQCDQGYLSDTGCSITTVADHIFSGSSDTLSSDDDGRWDDDDAVGATGYNIKYYLIPSQYGATTFGNPYGIYSNYGLPPQNDRYNTIWTSMLNTTALVDATAMDLYFSARSPPDDVADTTDGANEAMYAHQEGVYTDTLTNGYPECSYYAPSYLVGDNSTPVSTIAQDYSDVLADAVFSCPDCPSLLPGQLPNDTQSIYFNGTLWVASISTKDCDESSCKQYPYGYINYEASNLSPTSPYLGDDCPEGVDVMELNQEYYYYNHDQTMTSMTYLNLLSNLLLDPLLQTYSIQGGYSSYGDLEFDAVLISQSQSNILTVLAMMLLNGFWPLAVWRLSHERSNDIVRMMRTVGMRPSSYIMGMFFFDMGISILSGVAMIVFAVEFNLSQFKGAPVALLVPIVVVSAWALNSGALLLVKLLDKRSSVLPMLAPCLCVAAAAATSLLNVFVYTDDGDWPWYLSIVPFFAQGRALYIVLVYHASSAEVDTALSLMALFGATSLLCVYILEADVPVVTIVRHYLKDMISSPGDVDDGVAVEAHLIRASTGGNNSAIAMGNSSNERPYTIDDDVRAEMEKALRYYPPLSRKSLAASSEISLDAPAIVMQALRHVWSNGTVGVQELSLTMSYGECFGLLGPNGTGKSTTISILSGALRQTSGRVFVVGSDLSVDASAIHRYVGICPQFDVVWNDLTVEEHLIFQARQRGVFAHRLTAEVQKAAVAVGLDGDGFHTKAGQLSGGMRRRLSIAMSVVGDPPVVFMDEPTTGLDPGNKAHVWKIIQNLKTPERLILMTTHSMEEAEALCSRIGIMARGELQCIGSAHHLKSKFGKGYALTINLVDSSSITNDDELSSYVTDVLSGGHGMLISSINKTRKYLIPKTASVHISHIFKEMELNKSRLGVREWGLTMSTLEDVFISTVT